MVFHRSVVAGSIFGIIKLASKSQTPDSNSSTLALTISAINDNENIKGETRRPQFL